LASNGRPNWEPDQSIVLSSPDAWRNRNNKGLSIPHRQSNGWLNRQGEKSIEKLSVTKSDHLIIPSNYRRGGGTKANKQQLSSEEEESLNPNLPAGGSGLWNNNSERDKRRHPIESEHKESSTTIANINSERSRRIRDNRQIGTIESRQRPIMILARGEGVSEPSVNDSESRVKLPKPRMIPKKKEKDKGYR